MIHRFPTKEKVTTIGEYAFHPTGKVKDRVFDQDWYWSLSGMSHTHIYVANFHWQHFPRVFDVQVKVAAHIPRVSPPTVGHLGNVGVHHSLDC